MDLSAPTLQQMKLRAFDVGDRTAEFGRRSLRSRVERLRSRGFFIAQCAVSAGLAWWLATRVLNHPMPFFAPVASIICLGFTFGQRLRRGIDVALGVALGVLIGDLFTVYFGSGVWQLVVVIALAMTVATVLGAGQLLIVQSGVQSAIIVGLHSTPQQGLGRWLDAVVGCVVALGVALFVPLAPLRKPRLLTATVLRDFAATLRAARTALEQGDASAADAVLDQARAGDATLSALSEAADEGMAVVRYSPLRRRHRVSVQTFAELRGPLDRAHRNLRVLARRCAVSIWRHEEVPEAYRTLMSSLADVCEFMAEELTEHETPVAAQRRLVEVAQVTSHVQLIHSMSAVVILAQLRSMLADLLQLTGMDYEQARDVVPDMD